MTTSLTAGWSHASSASSQLTTRVGTAPGSSRPDVTRSMTSGRKRRESARDRCSVIPLVYMCSSGSGVVSAKWIATEVQKP